MNSKGIDLIEEFLAFGRLREETRKRLELPEGVAVEIAPVALEKFPTKIKEVVGQYCQKYGTKIHHWTVDDESCYYFDNDRVYLLKGNDHEMQVRMLLHELAHSTGHPDRLNRRGIGCASARA
jgi:antirestriction protein ArdC